jgi:hypothetical protein
VVTVRYEAPPWIEQGHTDKTDRGIERVVEWVEQRETEFKTHDAWEGIGRGCHYNVARQTIRSLLDAGLIVHIRGGKNHPVYLRFDLV